MNTRRVWKWWWGWNPERVEGFIEEMALEGWQLDRVSGNLIIFDFVRAEPETVRVCVDFQQRAGNDYMSLFEDAGWQCLGRSTGWYMWRQSYVGNRPEIYSDTGSLKARNQRVILTLLVVLSAQIPIFLINLNSIYTRVDNWMESPMAIFVLALYLLLVGALIFALTRLFMVNRKLGT